MNNKGLVVGLRQVKKNILANQVSRVYVAKDADWSIKLIIEELCNTYGVDIDYCSSKSELGQEVGINVPAATAAQLI